MSENHELPALLEEQRQLKAMESKLQTMILKINHQLNQLLVEELQLKSRDVQLTTEKKYSTKQPVPEFAFTSNATEINKQELDLGMQGSSFFKSLVESEDEL